KEALKPPAEREPADRFPNEQAKQRYEARERGDLIEIGIAPKNADGTADYRNYISLEFSYDAAESEILLAFESKLNRKLTDDEAKEINERRQGGLKSREWVTSPNRKWDNGGVSPYEGCYYNCDLTFDLVPDYL
ncbi:MAG: hypothetical protein DMF70_09060, partial [Acidobacteria bacterium]